MLFVLITAVSNEYTLYTIVYINKLPPFASWPGATIKLQWLVLPMSRTNFHCPKDV